MNITTSSVSSFLADRLPPCRICRLRAGMKTCPQSGAAAEIPPRLFPPPAAAGRNSPWTPILESAKEGDTPSFDFPLRDAENPKKRLLRSSGFPGLYNGGEILKRG